MSKELNKFKKIFGLEPAREYPTKHEYRVSDLDYSLNEARRLITETGLNLEAVCVGSMSRIRAFYVQIKE